MSTIGYATLQVIPSMRNISGAISGSLTGLSAVGKKAGQQIGDGIADGVEAKQSAVDKAAEKLSRARDKEADAAGKVRVEEARLQELRDKGVTEGARLAAAEERVAAARRRSNQAVGASKTATTELERAQKRLAESSDEVAESARGMDGAFDGLGEEAKGAAGSFGKLAIAAAGVGSAMEIATSAMDFQSVTAKMNASLGASGPLAAEYGKAAGDLYKQGLGDSMDDAAQAVSAVATSFVTLGSEGEVSLQKAGERAMNFAKVFDVDVNEAVQTASQLVTNGLATDSTQAFDLMTKSFQRVPAAMRAELPEILNEYGTNFRALGFDGQSSFNMLVAAADKGKFALDKTGDALKEFTIRGSDMSTTSTAAFQAIGLDAQEMSNKIASGGPAAQQALQATARGLLDVKDPADRANQAIALFGTPLEDLSVDQIPQFLSAIAGGENAMSGFQGSTDRMGQTLNDTAQSKLSSFGRSVQTGVIETLGKTLGFLQDNASLLKDLGIAAGVTGVALAALAGPQLLAAFKTMVTSTRLWAVAQGLLNIVMSANPFVQIALLIGVLVGAIILAYRHSETFRNIVQAAWNGIKVAIGAVWGWLSTSVFPLLQAAFRMVGAVAMWLWNNAIMPAWNGIKAAISVVWGWLSTSVFPVMQAAFRLIGTVALWLWNNVMAPAWNGIKAAISIAWTIISAVVDGIKGGFELIGRIASWLWNGVISPVWQWIGQKIDDTKIVIGFAIDVMKQHFQAIADKAGEIKDWIVDKFNKVIDFFKSIGSKIGDAAKGMWDGFKEAAKSAFNWVANIWNSTVGSISFKVPDWIPVVGGKEFSVPKIPTFASGGQVPAGNRNGLLYGPGTGTSDSILGIGANGMPTAAVSSGEFVVNARATAANLPLLRAINSGALQALAGGGVVGEPYGLPNGTNTGGYGSSGSIFPKWVHDLEAKWGLKASTYPGHQESDRNEAGYAPNPQGLNRGIDWSGPTEKLQAFAEYLMSIAPDTEALEQVIWQNPNTGQQLGWHGRQRDDGSYFAADYGGHTDHVHTRQSASFPEPPAPPPATDQQVPAEPPATPATPPATTETPDTSTTTETKTPPRMKSFRELGSDVGGIVADGIVETFGIPSWIADPASAVKVDDGSSVRTDGTSSTTETPSTPETQQTPTQPATPSQPAAPPPPKNPAANDYSGWITKAAKDLNLPERAAVIGNATGLVEAGDPMKMWANSAVPESLNYPHDAVGSDGTSVGVFQQQDNGAWGTLAERMDAYKSAKLFFAEMVKIDGWQTMPEGDVAQAVQRSAFPGRYAQMVPRAQQLVKQAGLYDSGGWLQPGGLAVNHLRKPEPVLHPDHWSAVVDQTEAVDELVGAGVGGRGGDLNVTVYGQTTGDIVSEFARHQWRGSRGYGSRGH